MFSCPSGSDVAARAGADVDDRRPSSAPAVARRERVSFRRLTLTDFRSYARADLALDGRPVALTGPNGAGKTNLLEAISLFGPGRGLRSARFGELARAGGAGGWAAAGALAAAGGGEARLGVGAHAEAPEKRLCRVDGGAASGPGAFAAYARFVWLTPAQDRLFVEGAGERRRFLDRMTQARDPAHGRAAGDFEKATRQRQKLLDEGVRDDRWLAALESQMAASGVAVAAARRETAAILDAADLPAVAPDFPAAEVSVDGLLENALAERPAADVEDEYADRLRRQRAMDAAAGRALAGPHRSDLLVSHRRKAHPARLCSTGEQKALLIGLVLANAAALARLPSGREGAAAPLIMLLDEIAAHLDERRRAALFDILCELGFQVFMTGTDKSLFSAWGGRAQCFSVEAGVIRPYEN